MMKKLISLTALTFLFLSLSELSMAKTIVETAYGRRADITILEEVVKLKDLKEIIQLLKKSNVKIYKVITGPNKGAFDFLKEAPVSRYPELAEKKAEVDSGSALFCTKNEFKNAKTNIILIAHDAEPMTVIHEFIHHLFETQNHEMTEHITKNQENYTLMIRKFNFLTRKVMMDNSLLTSKQWRDDIKKLSESYADSMDEGQGHIAAEEVAIETTLVSLIPRENTLLFNSKRAIQGINGYSMGLTIRSESLVNNIFALNNLIVTEGLDQDPEATLEERKDWDTRKAAIEKKLKQYTDGPLVKMREQIKLAQGLLDQ